MTEHHVDADFDQSGYGLIDLGDAYCSKSGKPEMTIPSQARKHFPGRCQD
jgi:hypothetical protein